MTIEEIIAKAEQDSDFRNKLVSWSANKTDEGKELLKNYADAEVEKQIKTRISEIHSAYDKDVEEVLGVKKKEDQKTYDFIKELLGELKELRAKGAGEGSEEVKKLKIKIKELEDSGSDNALWKKRYEEVVEKAGKDAEKHANELKAKDEQFVKTQIESEIRSAVSSLKFKADFPKEAIDALISVNTEKMLKNAKLVDGKVIFVGEDGSTKLNEQYKPVTTIDEAKVLFGSMIDDGTGNDKGGGGAPRTVGGKIVTTGEGDNATKKLVLDKETFSTKYEFQRVASDALRKQGISATDKDYQTLIDSAYEEYGVSELELQ